MKKMRRAVLAGLAVALIAAYLLGGDVKPAPVRISFAGDIMLSRGVGEFIETNGYDYPYEYVREIFLNDDLTIGNLECPLTESENAVNKAPVILFKADAENAAAMKSAGIDCLSLANNHTMDYGSPGLSDTMAGLSANELSYFGAGETAKSIFPYVFEKGGLRIGFLAYSALPAEGFFYNANKPTVQYISPDELSVLEHDIGMLGECDFVVVLFHWGEEFESNVTESQETLAKAAIDYGADLVVGAHPHVLQRVEVYQEKYIFYSLGNFVFDKQLQEGTDESLILQVRFEKGSNPQFELTPVIISDCRPEPASENRSQSILQSLQLPAESVQ